MRNMTINLRFWKRTVFKTRVWRSSSHFFTPFLCAYDPDWVTEHTLARVSQGSGCVAGARAPSHIVAPRHVEKGVIRWWLQKHMLGSEGHGQCVGLETKTFLNMGFPKQMVKRWGRGERKMSENHWGTTKTMDGASLTRYCSLCGVTSKSWDSHMDQERRRIRGVLNGPDLDQRKELSPGSDWAYSDL